MVSHGPTSLDGGRTSRRKENAVSSSCTIPAQVLLLKDLYYESLYVHRGMATNEGRRQTVEGIGIGFARDEYVMVSQLLFDPDFSEIGV